MTILSIFNQFPLPDLPAAQFTLTVLLVKEDDTVGARDVGQLELLAVPGLDEGHAQGVGAAAAVLGSQEVAQTVAGPGPHLHLVAEGLQSLQSHPVVSGLRVTLGISIRARQTGIMDY